MALEKIFNEDELNGLASNLLQQKAQEIKQRFDYRRSFYHNLRNTLFDSDQWTLLNNKLTEFDNTTFQNWNTQWNNIYRSPNIQNLTSFFNNGIQIFSSFEESAELDNIKPNYTHSDEIESLKEDLINRIDEDMVTIKNQIIEQVNNGIQNLVELKAELGLSQNFSENLNREKGVANKTRFIFLGGFTLSLIVISSWIITSYKIDFIKELDIIERIAIRFGVSIPIGFLSYFLFNQFKIYQMLHLKYTHLSNFLGGGATFISQLIGQDADSKKITNQKLANMFMEIEDLMSIIKKTKHPTDSSVDSGNKVLGTVLDKVSDISKSIKDIKSS